MIKTSFPHPWHTTHRAVLSPEQHATRVATIRRVSSAALLAAAATIVALVCTEEIPATMLLFAVGALAAAPYARWGTGLLETVVPQPLHGADLVTESPTMLIQTVTPRAGNYPRRETAVAEAVGVYGPGRHKQVPADDTPTTSVQVVAL